MENDPQTPQLVWMEWHYLPAFILYSTLAEQPTIPITAAVDSVTQRGYTQQDACNFLEFMESDECKQIDVDEFTGEISLHNNWMLN